MSSGYIDMTKRIGYTPYSVDLDEPGDRRRFLFYAKYKGIKYEIADTSKYYDIVYINVLADLPSWIMYKRDKGKECKLIFELIDSYFVKDFSWVDIFRNVNFSFKKKSYLNFKSCLSEMCKIADYVVCSTIEQYDYIRKFNKNVHIILDIFEDDINIQNNIKKYQDGKIHIAWEGQPYTLINVSSIKNALNTLADKVILHVITDPYFYKFSKKYIKIKTKNILSEINNEIIFHEWKKKTFVEDIQRCHMAIIPIDLSDNFNAGKPENKLILLWKIGIPVITSATPAYVRAMQAENLDMYCYTEKEGVDKILLYGNQNQKKIESCIHRISNQYSLDKAIYKWDNLFGSIFASFEK